MPRNSWIRWLIYVVRFNPNLGQPRPELMSLNRALQKRFPKTLLASFRSYFPVKYDKRGYWVEPFFGNHFSLTSVSCEGRSRCQTQMPSHPAANSVPPLLWSSFRFCLDPSVAHGSKCSTSCEMKDYVKVIWEIDCTRCCQCHSREKRAKSRIFFPLTRFFFRLGGSEQRSVPKVPLISEEGGCHDKGCWGETNA